MSNNGISHDKVAPYHLSSNKLAERPVQILKRNMEHQIYWNIEDKTRQIFI